MIFYSVCKVFGVNSAILFLPGEAVGLRGVGGGGRAGLGGREALELPGDGAGDPVPLTVWPLGTMTHSSESLEGDVSLLDLGGGYEYVRSK